MMIVRDIRGPRLKVYSHGEWERYLEPIKDKPREIQDKIMRYFNSTSLDAAPDSQGRVGITNVLLAHAGFVKLDPETGAITEVLSREAVVIGCGDYAEIWEASEYKRAMAAEDPAAMLEELRALGL